MACHRCLRRAWLLAQLSARLAYRARKPERLLEALELNDEQLVRALAGRRKEELLTAHAQFTAAQLPPVDGVERICRHHTRYPARLYGERAPATLHVAGGVARMHELLRRPTVAIVGTRRASDYGMEVAYSLARDLAASGVTVVGGFAEGVAAAAHQGALRAGDGGVNTVTVMAGGVDRASPASWRALHRRIVANGCALAELPCGSAVRGWCHVAQARIVVALAQLVIVVEAHERPAELLPARLAAAAGTKIAAVPGRVCAPAAAGPHLLLREEGALMVRGVYDVLDALHGVDAPDGIGEQLPMLAPAVGSGRARSVWEEVGAGNDTVEKLTASACLEGEDPRELLVALAQLECRGAVVRGDGGRYVACM
ncbi:MAG TPA: DNA-processing protein DprA [Solirubrobacteraceae bacterium]|jgi:DNA processing protein|nr:DNA-processing protein DprA [Solirubrobacteraceae bacterium]